MWQGLDKSGKNTLWLIRSNQEANVGVYVILSKTISTQPDYNT